MCTPSRMLRRKRHDIHHVPGSMNFVFAKSNLTCGHQVRVGVWGCDLNWEFSSGKLQMQTSGSEKSCRTRCFVRVSVSRGSTLVSFLSASGGLQVRKLWHSARDAKQKKYFCYKNRTPFWAGSDLGSHLPAVGCSEHELSQRRAGVAERRATSPVILFCFSTSCAKPCRASWIIACNCSSSKTSCSAVACSSTNLFAPVMTKFMSTSA